MLLAFVLMLGLLTACQKDDGNNYYISFARTSRNLETSVYYFDLDDEEVKLAGWFDYNAQYPLGVYSEENNSIYYSAKAENGSGDQLWCYDLAAETKTQLTDEIYAINYIVPLDGYIYLVAWCYDNAAHALNIYRYDINQQTLSCLQDDVTFSIDALSYSPENNEFIFAGQDANEMLQRLADQSIETPFYYPTNSVYRMQDDELSFLFATADNNDITGIVMNDKYILYRTVSDVWKLHEDGSFTGSSYKNIYLRNRETAETTEIESDTFSAISKFIYLDNNDNFYATYSESGSVQLIMINLDDLHDIHKIQILDGSAFMINNGIALK